MAKRTIPVTQDKETKLIEKLNANLNKVKPEKPTEPFVSIETEVEALSREASDAYDNGGTIVAAPATSSDEIDFSKVESDRQREIKYNAHADNVGYADAGPSPVWHNTMVFKDLSPEALDKLEKVIGPVAKSILERFDHNKNVLKDNAECRKAVNSEVIHTDSDELNIPSGLTDYGKKVFEAGRKVGRMAIDGKKTGRIDVGQDTAYEMVDHPTHYNQYDIEVIDMIIRIWGPEAAALWCDITAFKYRMRMGTKPDNSIEQDIKKEQWYLNKSKEIRENLIDNKN